MFSKLLVEHNKDNGIVTPQIPFAFLDDDGNTCRPG